MERTLLEIQSLAEFDEHITAATSLAGWLIQSVDLTHRTTALRRVDPAGAIFLGCGLTDAIHVSLVRRGARVFPRLDAPFDSYRATLYTAVELYDTKPYARSLDARIYAWQQAQGLQPSLPATLAMSLHDHAMNDALGELHDVTDHAIGVMGGHKLRRNEPGYLAAAQLGAGLAAGGATVLTGGGPGAMEAANLGARFASQPEALPKICAQLGVVPSFEPDIDAWVDRALTVCAEWACGEEEVSVGIPTWHYGHEPPNAFATHIAKYFQNSIREDILLAHCRAGIVFLPGAAGTIQEIFQATTRSYYAKPDTVPVPLVLVGRAYWTETFPAWQLLSSLGRGRAMERHLHLVDNVDEALDVLNGA